MSSHTRLLFILSLAACEHNATSEPVYAPAPAVPVKVAPAPVTQPEPAPVEPAVAPATPPPPAPTAATPPKLVKKCNPMSRAGCRWEKDPDERDKPRVTRRAVEKVTP